MNKFTNIKYFIIDVDGTLTDAGIYYDEMGNELKKFCTRDAAGFFALKEIGIRTVVLTGRECKATTRRMNDLRVDYIFQNIRDKTSFLMRFMEENDILGEQIGYIGDDLNDLAPMKMVGFSACPADSCSEIKEHVDYISPVCGGYGAVREIVEHYLRESGDWQRVIKELYGSGI